jgi:hypothetical protein
VSPSNTASSDGPVKGSAVDTQSEVDDQTKPHTFNGKLDEPDKVAQPAVGLTKDDDRRSWSERDRDEVAASEPATSAYAPVSAPGYGSAGTAAMPPSSGSPAYSSGSYVPSGPSAAGGYPAGGYPAQPAVPPTVTPVGRSHAAARRARLKVSHMGPLSVLRVSLTFSLCMFIVLLVAIAALWGVLDSSGVFKSIISAATTLTNDKTQTTGIAPWLSFGRVMLITVVLGAANVIAFTLLSTIAALLYNLCSDFVGGVEVTLVER